LLSTCDKIPLFFSNWRGVLVYSQLTTDEIAKLSTNRAGGCAWAVYATLSAHAWTKATVFPSIKRISEVIGDAYTHRAIYKALAFLEKIGLIVRKQATVKERFTLVMKVVGKKAKEAAKRAKEAKRKKEEAKRKRERQGVNPGSQNGSRVPYKREHKIKNNYSYSNIQEQNKIKSNHFMDCPPNAVDTWLEECLMYLEGSSKKKPSKIDRQSAINALKSNNAVACLIVEGGRLDDAISLL